MKKAHWIDIGNGNNPVYKTLDNAAWNKKVFKDHQRFSQIYTEADHNSDDRPTRERT
jgi:hypothetical protein